MIENAPQRTSIETGVSAARKLAAPVPKCRHMPREPNVFAKSGTMN